MKSKISSRLHVGAAGAGAAPVSGGVVGVFSFVFADGCGAGALVVVFSWLGGCAGAGAGAGDGDGGIVPAGRCVSSPELPDGAGGFPSGAGVGGIGEF